MTEEQSRPAAMAALTHSFALQRICSRGLPNIGSVIDAGCSNGCWSQMAESFWPEARYHLLDPLSDWEPQLAGLTRLKNRWTYTMAAAGESDGFGDFWKHPEDPYGGAILAGTINSTPVKIAEGSEAGKSAYNPRNTSKVRLVSIDEEVKRFKLPGPYVVKLDTHGTEREILAGAKQTLAQTQLLIVEVYNFLPEGRRFPEITAFIEKEFGFHCIDIGDPLFREADNAFWQIDLFFVKADRPEVRFKEFCARKPLPSPLRVWAQRFARQNGDVIVNVTDSDGDLTVSDALREHPGVYQLVTCTPDPLTVPLRLDEELPRFGIPHINLLRICPGRTAEVLSGAAGLLHNSQINFIDFELDLTDHALAEPVVLPLLRENYVLYVLDGEQLVPLQLWKNGANLRSCQILAFQERFGISSPPV